MKEDIVIFGCGGHAKSVIDCILDRGIYNVAAIVGTKKELGQRCCGIEVLYTDKDAEELFQKGLQKCFIAVGNIESFDLRERLYEWVKKIGFTLVNVIDKSAVISPSVVMGNGVFISKCCVVNVDSILGDMVILNTGCIVDHACSIGSWTHVSAAAMICGDVVIGERTFVGSNATVFHGKSIGNNCMIGAGSVVTKDISDGVKAYGNPCREVNK